MKPWRRPFDRDRLDLPRGEVQLIVDRCKGCAFCVEFCPREVLEMSPGFNRRGYHPPEVVHPEACVGCALCETLCPDFALFIEAPEGRQPVSDRSRGAGR